MKMGEKQVRTGPQRGLRRLPQARTSQDRRAALRPSGPAPSEARPFRFTTSSLRPKLEWLSPNPNTRNCFSATNKPPVVTLFQYLVLKCTHSRKYPGFAFCTLKKKNLFQAMVASAQIALDRDRTHHSKRGRD